MKVENVCQILCSVNHMYSFPACGILSNIEFQFLIILTLIILQIESVIGLFVPITRSLQHTMQATRLARQ